MILEYETIQRIAVENGCEHIIDGVIRFDDLIRTDYIPTNFSAEPKNFLLRDKHIEWDNKHAEFVLKIHREWLVELGYDPTLWQVEESTRKIIPNHRLFDDVDITESEEL
tara:strand:- start:231 stop:560 length:330 start_codon:yes stop_codon:yes gene_type:complete